MVAETLHEADGIEANMAACYHAVEFLLWGRTCTGTKPWPETANGPTTHRAKPAVAAIAIACSSI
ncbi:MAG: hypothetical protein OXN84_06835 [Albidovulum sp.]|nr:hypothetical protein [Albidovulum sp.]